MNNTISDNDEARQTFLDSYMCQGDSTSYDKASQVQLNTLLLTVGLVTVGLGAFIGLQSRDSKPPRKPLFQPHMTNAEACMPSSFVDTGPMIQRPCQLAYHQQILCPWGQGTTVICQIRGPAYRLMLDISTGKWPDTLLTHFWPEMYYVHTR